MTDVSKTYNSTRFFRLGVLTSSILFGCDHTILKILLLLEKLYLFHVAQDLEVFDRLKDAKENSCCYNEEKKGTYSYFDVS